MSGPHSIVFKISKTRAKITPSKTRSNTKSSKPIKVARQSPVRQKNATGVFMPHPSTELQSIVSKHINLSTPVSVLITKDTHKLLGHFSLNKSRINSKNNLRTVMSTLFETYSSTIIALIYLSLLTW